MGEYTKEQISNFAKVEAAIGLGISTLIMNFVVQSALTGADMPLWAMWILLMLFVVFLIVRTLAIVQYIVEKEAYNREQRSQGELKLKELQAQVAKLDKQAQIKLAEARLAEARVV